MGLDFTRLYFLQVSHTQHPPSGQSDGSRAGSCREAAVLGLSIAAVALSSGSVAVGGSFFFVGLIAPHMAKKTGRARSQIARSRCQPDRGISRGTC